MTAVWAGHLHDGPMNKGEYNDGHLKSINLSCFQVIRMMISFDKGIKC